MIRDALAEVTDGTTTIIIGHRPATIAVVDRVLLLDEGRIVAEGGHEELLATSAAYRECWHRPKSSSGHCRTMSQRM